MHDKAGVHGHGPWRKAVAAVGKSHRPPLAPEKIVAEPTMTSAWHVAPTTLLYKACSADPVADPVTAVLTALLSPKSQLRAAVPLQRVQEAMCACRA